MGLCTLFLQKMSGTESDLSETLSCRLYRSGERRRGAVGREGVGFITFDGGMMMIGAAPRPMAVRSVSNALVAMPASILVGTGTRRQGISSLFIQARFVKARRNGRAVREVGSICGERFSGKALIVINDVVTTRTCPKRMTTVAPMRKFRHMTPSRGEVHYSGFAAFTGLWILRETWKGSLYLLWYLWDVGEEGDGVDGAVCRGVVREGVASMRLGSILNERLCVYGGKG